MKIALLTNLQDCMEVMLKTSSPYFTNCKDISSKPEAFDGSKQAKTISIAEFNSKRMTVFIYIHVVLLYRIIELMLNLLSETGNFLTRFSGKSE